MDAEQATIQVEVCFAKPDEQIVIPLQVDAAATIEQVIESSGITTCCPEIGSEIKHVGVFGKARKLSDTLVDGDRVEIYRPLKADPKEVRRRLAAEGKTMGRPN